MARLLGQWKKRFQVNFLLSSMFSYILSDPDFCDTNLKFIPPKKFGEGAGLD